MAINYPGTIDVLTNPSGTSILNSPSHAGQHSDSNDAIEAIEAVIGTTAGTSIAKNFAAGDFGARINASNVLQQRISGTVDNAILGTPSISNGTATSTVLNTNTIGTPAITGGTATSTVLNTNTMGTPTVTGGTFTSVTFVAPALGTPASGVMTNVTGVPAAAILAGSFGAGAYVISTTLSVGGAMYSSGASAADAASRIVVDQADVNTSRILVQGPDTLTNGKLILATNRSNGTNYIIGMTVNGDGSIQTSGNIELGHATDTTISRVSAGLIAVEGVTVVDVSTAQTLTNKSISGGQITSAVATATDTVSKTGTGSVYATSASPTLTTPAFTGLPTGTGVATANTMSTLVARDSSGNFAAGTITAALTGTASGNLTSANIVATITNGVTTNAPSEDAVFDALALKAPLASPTFTGTVTVPVGLTGVLRADTGVVSVDTDVTDIVAAGTSTAAGKLELATDVETVTGTDTARATTPANIVAKMSAPGAIGNTTASTGKFTTVETTGGIELGHATDTTITRTGAGDIAIEGNAVYRAGGTDVPVADGGTGASTVAAAALNLSVTPNDGWVSANETWTYATANTITVPSGAAAKYQKGDRIKWTQTTVKYGVIITVADTVLTIAINNDYVVTNAAISANYYSHELNPLGYPTWFNYTPTSITWTGGTPPSGAGSSKKYVFKVDGMSCTVSLYIEGFTPGASNTNVTATLPINAANQQWASGFVNPSTVHFIWGYALGADMSITFSSIAADRMALFSTYII